MKCSDKEIGRSMAYHIVAWLWPNYCSCGVVLVLSHCGPCVREEFRSHDRLPRCYFSTLSTSQRSTSPILKNVPGKICQLDVFLLLTPEGLIPATSWLCSLTASPPDLCTEAHVETQQIYGIIWSALGVQTSELCQRRA